MLNRLDRPAAALVVATFGLLVFGASVRVHGAGLACPDWPLCFGQVVPEVDFQVGLEFGHRVVAGVIGLAFLGLGGAVVAGRKKWGSGAVALVALAAVALAAQIVLGGLTVLQLLAQWTVASHLLVGNTFCALLLLLALSLRERVVSPVRVPRSAALRGLAVVLAVLVPVQLGLGGWVSSSYAGLACGDWPTCDGTSFVPTLDGLVGLQIVHRFAAYAILGVALAAAAFGRGRAEKVVLVAVLAQIVLGVANVWLRLPAEVTLLHTAGAAAIYLSVTWLVWDVWRAPLAVARAVRVPALGGAR